MKGLKIFLIVLFIIAVAVFTGTWIFGSLGWLFTVIGKFWYLLEKVFNLFGWNGGIV